MGTTAFEELERAYDEAIALDPASRGAYVEDLRSRSGELAARLAAMLGADTQSVDASVREVLAEAEQRRAGDRLIGPYRVLGELGEGGFGVVYLAEQSAPIRRLVAVKLIKPGMDSKAALARFNDERQALALLDHPAIVQALDAGTSAEGWPYFVMPLVPGLSITRFCEEGKATIADRVRLVIEVCRGVQHAHGRGVLHRDLKPSNVLVASEGGAARPRIIDFGLARSLTTALTEHQTLTLAGQPLGTPEYMSPEQAAGRPVDVRSDVYALGAILYELLAGRAPIPTEALRSAGSRGIAGVVADHVVTPPSRAGAREVPRELDWVVMRCLEKEPERRYPTAEALAADLERFLDGRAVEAGPPGGWYRTRAWLWRYRRPVAALAAIGVVIVAAAGVAGVFALREHRERAAAEQALAFLDGVFSGLDPIVAQGRDRTLLRTAIERAARDMEQQELRPELKARLSRSLAEAFFVIGEYARAKPLAEQSLALCRDLYGPNDPRSIDALRGLIAILRTGITLEPMPLELYRELKARATEHLPRGSRLRIECLLQALHGSESEYSDATREFDALIAETSAAIGPNDRLTLRTLRAAAFTRSRDLAWTLATLREARRRAIEAYGPDDPECELGFGLESHATIRIEGEAAFLELVRTRLEPATRLLGEDAAPVFTVRYNFANLLMEKRLYGEAERQLQLLRASAIRRLGPEAGWINWLDANLFLLYRRTGRDDLADETEARMFEGRPNGPSLSAEFWIDMSLAQFEAGREDRFFFYAELLQRTDPRMYDRLLEAIQKWPI